MSSIRKCIFTLFALTIFTQAHEGHSHDISSSGKNQFSIKNLSLNVFNLEALDYIRTHRDSIYGLVLDEAEEVELIHGSRGNSLLLLSNLVHLVDITQEQQLRTKKVFERALKEGFVNRSTIQGAAVFGDQDTIKIIEDLAEESSRYSPELIATANSSLEYIRKNSVFKLPIFSNNRSDLDHKLMMLALPREADNVFNQNDPVQDIIDTLNDSEIERLMELSERNELNMRSLFLGVLKRIPESSEMNDQIRSHAEKMARIGDENSKNQARVIMKKLPRSVHSFSNKGESNRKVESTSSEDEEAPSIKWPYYVGGGLLLALIGSVIFFKKNHRT